MTISANGNAGGNFADAGGNATYDFGGATLPLGALVVVGGAKYTEANDPFIAGDCTKSAGTAAISTVTLDRSDGTDMGTNQYGFSAIWSFRITTAGTLTIQVAGDAGSNSYMVIGAECFTTNQSWNDSRQEANNGATNTGNSISSMSTGNATSAGAALFFGSLALFDQVTTSITGDASFFATPIYEQENVAHQCGSFIYRIVSSGTTDAADWTFNTTDGNSANGAAASLQVFKEAATGSNAGKFRALMGVG